jgi:hypothetical protein
MLRSGQSVSRRHINRWRYAASALVEYTARHKVSDGEWIRNLGVRWPDTAEGRGLPVSHISGMAQPMEADIPSCPVHLGAFSMLTISAYLEGNVGGDQAIQRLPTDCILDNVFHD